MKKKINVNDIPKDFLVDIIEESVDSISKRIVADVIPKGFAEEVVDKVLRDKENLTPEEFSEEALKFVEEIFIKNRDAILSAIENEIKTDD